MEHADFVHLHNHTQYSLLDGACKIDNLLALAKSYKMPALAITDHGNMFGAIEFYKKAISQGIKPILGIEAYVAPEDLHKKEPVRGLPDTGFHLVLLVKNYTGYKNLIKLATIGYLEGFYFKPRIDKKVLKQHSEGLIALSACLSGEIPVNLLENRYEQAKKLAFEFADIFGKENFFLEIQDHDIDLEKKNKEEIQKLAKELNFNLVATNDCHYLKREHFQAHDALLCIQTGKLITDTDRLKFGTDQVYFKSPEEMKELFKDYPKAIENTLRIAEECNLELEFGKSHLPHFPLPRGFESLENYLEYTARIGLTHRYGKVTPALEERLNYELKVIKQMGYPSYFLIVKDFIDYAKSQNIPVGPGRGSAAGSLVSYALGITNIDPIRYGLIFERFLNPERISMPDIDIDFSDWGRDKVIKYVIQKYGEENVSQIITFGTMAARAVVRDVGRVMNMSYSEVDRIAKMIPFEVDMTLEKALQVQPELKKLAETNPQVKKLISHSQILEGLSRHASTHAAGVVIAPTRLTEFVPLYKTNKDEITTQYDMLGIEDIGLLKIDFLGLRTLTVIDDTLERLRKNKGLNMDIEKIPLDDKKVYELFSRGETVGIFQFESAGMRDYLKKLKPEHLEDISAMNALYRPGPLDSYMVDEYIERKRGFKEIKYEHPLLETILKETYGVIVYQEQVIQIASELAGYSLSKADILRKAIGKKQASLLAQQKTEFIKGCKAHGVKDEIAGRIFELISTFGRYGFNKSHSVGYALVAYQTAYLKTYYPKEFMAATMSTEMGDTNRIVILMEECKRMGMEVLPPDVNESFANFQVIHDKIRFGLVAVKNVGSQAVEAIVQAREKYGRIETFFQFCERVDIKAINRKTVESLIYAGAFDCIHKNRASLIVVLDMALEYGQTLQKEKSQGQFGLFSSASQSASGGLAEPKLPEVEHWTYPEILSREKQMLGFYISGHPLSDYKEQLKLFTTHSTESLEQTSDNQEVNIGGILTNLKTNIDKKGKQMAFATLEDFFGAVELVIFSDVFEKFRELIYTDSLIWAKGRTSTKEGEKPKIIVNHFMPLEEVNQKLPGKLHLLLGKQDFDSSSFDNLKKLLSFSQGHTPVFLHVNTNAQEKVSVRLKNITVLLTEKLVQDLKQLVGEENIHLELEKNNFGSKSAKMSHLAD